MPSLDASKIVLSATVKSCFTAYVVELPVPAESSLPPRTGPSDSDMMPGGAGEQSTAAAGDEK